jgi:hypothetical protein
MNDTLVDVFNIPLHKAVTPSSYNNSMHVQVEFLDITLRSPMLHERHAVCSKQVSQEYVQAELLVINDMSRLG